MPQGVNASKYGAFGEKIKINAYKSKSLMNYQGIVDHLREAVASLSAVYVFGSQVTDRCLFLTESLWIEIMMKNQ